MSKELLENGHTQYGLHALNAEYHLLCAETKGFRNTKLNEVACKMGSLVASGQLKEDTVYGMLTHASRNNGLVDDDGLDKVRATIKSGLQHGLKNPRYPEEREQRSDSNVSGRTLNTILAADVKAKPIDWLWEGVLARGALSLIGGDPGLGKSQIASSIAAVVSTGGKWPVSNAKAKASNVIVVSSEDDPAYTIVPRLMAAGADLAKVHILTTVSDDKGQQVSFKLDRDIPLLRAWIEEIGDVDLVVIDPVTAYMGDSKANDSGDVRGITTELASLASDFDTCIIGITHLNKTVEKDAMYRFQGSMSWVGAARTAYAVTQNADSPELRNISPAKNNLAIDNAGFTFTIESVELPDDLKTSRVKWEEYSQTITANQALIDRSKGGGRLREAIDFVEAELVDGAALTADIAKRATEEGISSHTIKDALDKLTEQKLIVTRKAPGKGGKWYRMLVKDEEAWEQSHGLRVEPAPYKPHG